METERHKEKKERYVKRKNQTKKQRERCNDKRRYRLTDKGIERQTQTKRDKKRKEDKDRKKDTDKEIERDIKIKKIEKESEIVWAMYFGPKLFLNIVFDKNFVVVLLLLLFMGCWRQSCCWNDITVDCLATLALAPDGNLPKQRHGFKTT